MCQAYPERPQVSSSKMFPLLSNLTSRQWKAIKYASDRSEIASQVTLLS